MKLLIVDPKTNSYPEVEDMQSESWYPFDTRLRLDGFLLDEEGNLALADRCGNHAYPPQDRFKVAIVCKNGDKYFVND